MRLVTLPDAHEGRERGIFLPDRRRMRAKAYLLNRLESRVCRLNGILHSSLSPDKPELRQSFVDRVRYTDTQLPPKVDLRMHMTPVEDQSKVGSW